MENEKKIPTLFLLVLVIFVTFWTTSYIYMVWDKPDVMRGPYVGIMATYDNTGDPVVVRYVIRNITITESTVDEIEYVFKEYVRKSDCHEVKSHHLARLLYDYFDMYIPTIIEIVC